ncbi:DNA/RNA non-specific endonuclease [Microbacterium karelineae]|uniref:DNA/RNA non-specific endonuclease n=1 Tax=Microbacterium karelineae TaxID=2654283 RepID=UPI0012EA7CEA|nr:DNA/RNA non-specific endonuclease [Microbacterium karelineae]
MGTEVKITASTIESDAATFRLTAMDIESAISTLQGVLNANAGMAGDDNAAEEFVEGEDGYDASAEGLLTSAQSVANGFWVYAAALENTARTYNAAQAAGAGEQPDVTKSEASEVKDPPDQRVSSALGPGWPGALGEMQEVIEWGLQQVGVVIPTGDEDKLKSAASGWETFSSSLSAACRRSSGGLTWAGSMVIPQTSGVEASRSGLNSSITSLQGYADGMVTWVNDYVDQLHIMREQLKDFLQQMAIELAADLAITAILSVFTFGLGAIAGSAKAAATVIKWAKRIKELIDKLKNFLRGLRGIGGISARAAVRAGKEGLQAAVASTFATSVMNATHGDSDSAGDQAYQQQDVTTAFFSAFAGGAVASPITRGLGGSPNATGVRAGLRRYGGEVVGGGADGIAAAGVEYVADPSQGFDPLSAAVGGSIIGGIMSPIAGGAQRVMPSRPRRPAGDGPNIDVDGPGGDSSSSPADGGAPGTIPARPQRPAGDRPTVDVDGPNTSGGSTSPAGNVGGGTAAPDTSSSSPTPGGGGATPTPAGGGSGSGSNTYDGPQPGGGAGAAPQGGGGSGSNSYDGPQPGGGDAGGSTGDGGGVDVSNDAPTAPDSLPSDGPGGMPDGAQPDGAMPDGAQPDGAMPDGATPDGAQPDGAQPDGAMPDGAQPDGAMPDGAQPDGAMPDGAQPDGATPDGAQPDGATPDGAMPDGAQPDGATPDGATPDGAQPDGAMPDGAQPDGAMPDGAQPDGATPDGAQPDGAMPDGAQPDGATPDGAMPDGAQPDGAQPDGATPDGAQPDGAQPDGATPDGAQPDGAQPDGAMPDGATPDGAQPDGARPDGADADAAPQDASPEPDSARSEDAPAGGVPRRDTGSTDTDATADPEGATPDAEAPTAADIDGARSDGAGPDGATPDGVLSDGTTPEGVHQDGATSDGAGPDGVSPDGATTTDASPRDGEDGPDAPMSPEAAVAAAAVAGGAALVTPTLSSPAPGRGAPTTPRSPDAAARNASPEAWHADDIVDSSDPAGDGWERLQDVQDLPEGQGRRTEWDKPIDPDYGKPDSDRGAPDFQDGWQAHPGLDALSPEVRALVSDADAPYGRDSEGNPLSEQGFRERFLEPDGGYDYPGNAGAVPGSSVRITDLGAFREQYGNQIDRLGSDRGDYFGLPGSSFESRSLPPSNLTQPYTMSDLRSLPPGGSIEVSRIAPAFGRDGGGLQFRILDSDDRPQSRQALLDNGHLAPSTRDSSSARSGGPVAESPTPSRVDRLDGGPSGTSTTSDGTRADAGRDGDPAARDQESTPHSDGDARDGGSDRADGPDDSSIDDSSVSDADSSGDPSDEPSAMRDPESPSSTDTPEQIRDKIDEALTQSNTGFDPHDLSNGYATNCGNVSVNMHDFLNGKPIADAGTGTLDIPDVEARTGLPQTEATPSQIEASLRAQGPGANAVIGIDRGPDQPGHWFNAVFDGEQVWVVDGQDGTRSPWPPHEPDATYWDASIDPSNLVDAGETPDRGPGAESTSGDGSREGSSARTRVTGGEGTPSSPYQVDWNRSQTPFARQTDLEPDSTYEVPGRGTFHTGPDGRVVRVETTYGPTKLNFELHKLQPDTTYVVTTENGASTHTFRTDDLGRTISAHTDNLDFDDARRAEGVQSSIGGEGGSFFDGGHLFGNQYGGGGERVNVVPMLRDVNQALNPGSFYALESHWADLKRANPDTPLEVLVEPIYGDDSTTPMLIHVSWVENGIVHTDTFENFDD